jgi:hypothetical protein
MHVQDAIVPSRGDHVVQHRTGVPRVGHVWYADQLQVLVKWRDGSSSCLRIGRDCFSIRAAAQDAVEDERAAPPLVQAAAG